MKSAILYLSWCLLFVIGIYRPWFGTLDTFTWGDWGWYFAETVKPWMDFPRIWFTGSMGGIDVSIFQYLPNRLFYGALAQIFQFEVFDRVVFILPSVIFPIITSFILVRYLTKSNIAASVGAMTYTLNSYLAATRTGHFTLSVSFALAPLILMLLIKSLDERKAIYSVFSGFVSALAFAYEPRAFLLTWAVGIAYGLYYFILEKSSGRERVKLLAYVAVPMVMVLLLHSYAFIGLFYAANQIRTTITNRALFGAGYVNINRALATANFSWDEFSGRSMQNIPIYFWITTLTSMAGMWLGRRNKVIVFFTIVALGGIFLNKHTNQPFGDLYVWLYKYLPGFNAFREPSKFYFYISLAYTVLTGWFVAWAVKQKYKLLGGLLVAIAILPFVLNGLTIAQGKIGKLMTPRHMPKEYLVLKEFLQNHPGEYRVLYVPFEVKWGYWDEHIRKSSAAEFVLRHWTDLFPYRPDETNFSYFNYTMSLFASNKSNYLLDLASVRYVLVPSEDLANEDIFTFSWGKRGEFLREVEALTYLQKVDIGDSAIDVFENPDRKPLIYVTGSIENFETQPDSDPVTFNQVKTFHYRIQPNNETSISGKILNFSDLYNPGWKLYYGPVTWVDVLLRKHLIPIVSHSESIIHTNQFQLPLELDENDVLTLYFEPQAYIYVGVIISLVSLGSILTGLISYRIRRKAW